MINQELAELFGQMAEILVFLGDSKDHYKIRAYQNVSESILDAPEPLEKLAREHRLKEIPGVGEGIAGKIEEYLANGKLKEFELMKRMVPEGFFELLAIPFLGPKKVKTLNVELGIATVNDLKNAIKKGMVQELPGFGARSAEKILEGIDVKAATKGRRPIGEVYSLVVSIVEAMKKCKEVIKIEPAGSFRRAEETVGDIDILATGKDHKKIMEYFLGQSFVEKVLVSGDTKSSILTGDGLQVDLRVVEPKQFGSALQYFTGSKMHNVHLRTFAKNRGFKLSEYGFFKGKKLVGSKTEEECYGALGMQYVPPELRTDTGEIEAAYNKKIPKLIELKDIRGDLHTHSIYSDGANSIREMAIAAHKRGYEYIALTDHSPSLIIANGLSLDRLKKKKLEIDRLNNELPIKILFGTEVDILRDGSIDYPDEILREFDIVVASIHSSFARDNTDRILKAMENQYVHIIAHPSGRLIGKRNPYPVDYEKVFRVARETGTVLEINSQYLRLDLQDEHIREAKRQKCLFSIGSDSHTTQSLGLMELGVRWARRGWVEKADVVNTLPLAQLKKNLKKRASKKSK